MGLGLEPGITMKNVDFKICKAWVSILALPLTSQVTLDKSLHHSQPVSSLEMTILKLKACGEAPQSTVDLTLRSPDFSIPW